MIVHKIIDALRGKRGAVKWSGAWCGRSLVSRSVACRQWSDDLASCPHFDFGDLEPWMYPGAADDAARLLNAGFLRLPFPRCSFSWRAHKDADARTRSAPPTDTWVASLSCDTEGFEASMFCWAPDLDCVIPPFVISGTQPQRSSDTEFVFSYEQCQTSIPDGYTVHDLANWHVTAVPILLLGLNSRGVQRRIEPAPDKLNKQRARKGLCPLFAHTVLTLGSPVSESTHGLGGGHASPRMHLRRGHLRVLESRTTWVRPCVVAAYDGSNGAVTHDYVVKAPKDAS